VPGLWSGHLLLFCLRALSRSSAILAMEHLSGVIHARRSLFRFSADSRLVRANLSHSSRRFRILLRINSAQLHFGYLTCAFGCAQACPRGLSDRKRTLASMPHI